MYKLNFILLLIFTTAAYQQSFGGAGDLDLAFGNNGKIVTDIGTDLDTAGSIIIQPDNKIIAVGYAYSFTTFDYDFALVRYNSDGTIDQSFGNNGKVTTDFGANFDFALSGNLQPDGKIIAVGYTGFGFALVRYNSNGTLDTTFDGDGKVSIAFTGTITGWSSLVQPDGKIVAAGSVRNGSNYDFALIRCNSDGLLDSTFGTSGRVTTEFSALRDEIRSLAIQRDGKIVAAGFASNGTNSDFAIARYNSDGSLDNTFDSDGKVTTSLGNGNDLAYSIAIQNDGKYILAGESFTGTSLDTAIVRYLSDGSLDTSFNSTGKTFVPFGMGDDGAYSVVIQQNGKIVTTGYSGSMPNRNFALVRLNPNGTVDLSFNSTGKVVTDFGTSDDGGANIKLQQNGKIVVAGYRFTQNNASTGDFALARYEGDLVVFQSKSPFDFDGDGKTDIGIFRPNVGEWWLNRSSSGQTTVAQFGQSTDKPVPTDFTGDGKTDIAVWRPSSGEWFVLRSEDSSFYSFPFGTSGDTPIVGDFDADGKADAGIFRPSTLTWYISKSSGGTIITTFGTSGDVPVAADYDGDGKTDIAIYRPSFGQWWIQRSSNQSVYAFQFGTSSDKPVQGDYTGDGKADSAFFRPSTGEWFILRSEDSSFYSVPFGTTGDLPSPGDYDGDGKFDTAVFRPATNTWFINRTTAGILITNFGTTNDRPIPNVFVP
jgi:uncharacterized delta-60 repeat protein